MKEKAPKTLGQRLQVLLDAYDLSPEKAAAIVKMTGPSIRSMLKGESNPYKSTVEKIAKSLGSTYDWLNDGEGQMLPNGKLDFDQSGEESPDPWKDEAWTLAKDQLTKKDDTIDKLTNAFDRLTLIMSKIDPSAFLRPVKKTA